MRGMRPVVTSRSLGATATLVALILTLGACQDGDATKPGGSDGSEVQVASVGVTPELHTLYAIDATGQFTAIPRDASGSAVSGRSTAWSSSDSSVATVDSTGLVTGVANGATSVAAWSDGITDTAAVSVSNGPAPTVFFTEGFEDSDFAARGWYDNTSLTITTAEQHSGNSSLEIRFVLGATGPTFGAGTRHLFTETESVYLSYWIKYSANWLGSGQTAHPHEFYFLTNGAGNFSGLAFTNLTAYVEHNYQNGGIPFLRVQDGANVDQSRVGQDLTGVTARTRR